MDPTPSSTPGFDDDWRSLATAEAFIAQMSESDGRNILWALRQKFGWYSELYDRTDIEALWNPEDGPLTDELCRRIMRRANDVDEHGASEFFSSIVEQVRREHVEGRDL